MESVTLGFHGLLFTFTDNQSVGFGARDSKDWALYRFYSGIGFPLQFRFQHFHAVSIGFDTVSILISSCCLFWYWHPLSITKERSEGFWGVKVFSETRQKRWV